RARARGGRRVAALPGRDLPAEAARAVPGVGEREPQLVTPRRDHERPDVDAPGLRVERVGRQRLPLLDEPDLGGARDPRLEADSDLPARRALDDERRAEASERRVRGTEVAAVEAGAPGQRAFDVRVIRQLERELVLAGSG